MGWAALGASAVGGGMSISGGIGEALGAAHAATRATRRARQAFQNRYKWTMQDMRNAGLNPILAAEVGGGSAAHVAQSAFPNIMEGAAHAAREFPAKKAELLLMAAERDKKVAEKQLADAQTVREGASTAREISQTSLNDTSRRAVDLRMAADAELVSANVKSAGLNQRMLGAALPGAEAQAALDKTTAGEWLRWINRAVRSVTGRDSTSAR